MSFFDYDSISAGYYDEVFARNKGIQSAWHHLKFAEVSSRVGDYKRHVDIGCGAGTLIGLLDKNKRSTGFDIAVDQIDYARKKYGNPNHSFEMLDKEGSVPLGDGSCDVITMIEVIEHLTAGEVDKLLREVYRLLSPGGKLILTTPNYRSLWPVLEIGVNNFSPISYKHQHIQHFTRRKVHQLLSQKGFENVRVRAFMGMAPFFAGLHWQAAAALHAKESALTSHLGLLLIAEAQKP